MIRVQLNNNVKHNRRLNLISLLQFKTIPWCDVYYQMKTCV